MQIEYLCHSSVLVNTGDAIIVTDPWFNGPAYQHQWNVFPQPVRTDFTKQTTHLVITHGHEDHLHGPTLSLFPKHLPVLYPYQWKNSSVKFLNELGFNNVIEGLSYKKIQLTTKTSVTYVANSLDAICVIESNGKVLVNLNDALNAHHKSIIHYLTAEIKTRWKKIDYILCGLGGAGYFPNTVHYEGKNDIEIGYLREQFLAHKFCELVQELQPENVISFVPGFVLLDESKRWINDVRFDREKLADYYKEHFDAESKINFLHPYPGDIIEDAMFIQISKYHGEFATKTYNEIAQEQYKNEIVAFNVPDNVTEARIQAVKEKLDKQVAANGGIYNKELLALIDYDVKITDAPSPCYFHIYYDKGILKVDLKSKESTTSNLIIETKLTHLEYTLDNEWGGDVFMIGYAAEIFVKDETALANNLDILSLRLLCGFPMASHELVKNPYRGLRFLASNPALSKILIRNKIKTNGNPNKLPHNERSHWLNKTKCEVCMACDLPLLSYSLGEEMHDDIGVKNK